MTYFEKGRFRVQGISRLIVDNLYEALNKKQLEFEDLGLDEGLGIEYMYDLENKYYIVICFIRSDLSIDPVEDRMSECTKNDADRTDFRSCIDKANEILTNYTKEVANNGN